MEISGQLRGLAPIPRKKILRYLLHKGLYRPQSWFSFCRDKKNLLSLPEIEIRGPKIIVVLTFLYLFLFVLTLN